MQTLILCGGLGTRAYPYTHYLPKPMLPINGSPMLMHVMRSFANQGHKDFVLSLGYNKHVIIDYFDRKALDWNIEFVDTGADTNTGGRIYGCRHILESRFLATYCDGLSDVALGDVLRFHDSHAGLATITSVPLTSQYGTLEFNDSGRIRSFREKPVLKGHWINAGFFVFDREVFDYWKGNDLEREVFPNLAREGLLYGYQHTGFFKSMDSYKDQQELEKLVLDGDVPWERRA